MQEKRGKPKSPLAENFTARGGFGVVGFQSSIQLFGQVYGNLGLHIV